MGSCEVEMGGLLLAASTLDHFSVKLETILGMSQLEFTLQKPTFVTNFVTKLVISVISMAEVISMGPMGPMAHPRDILGPQDLIGCTGP